MKEAVRIVVPPLEREPMTEAERVAIRRQDRRDRQTVQSVSFTLGVGGAQTLQFPDGEWLIVAAQPADLTVQFDDGEAIAWWAAGSGLEFSFDRVTFASAAGGDVTVIFGRGCPRPFKAG